MQPTDRHAAEVTDERAAEKRYADALRQRADSPLHTQGARSTYWTGSALTKPPPAASGELVGRVALDGPDREYLDGAGDFYIGDRHHDLDGIQVFSWAARVACTFFRGASHHELCGRVAVIRTFARSGGTLADFVDEALVENPPAQPFAKRILHIPTAPIRPKLPPKPVPSKAPDQRAPRQPQAETPTNPRHAPVPPGPAATSPLRAQQLLHRQLTAPRNDQLTSVLATLQPDQYEIVTTAGTTSRIIEGQPGTGKTIIAAHRAAFLVSEDIDMRDRVAGKVMLVGPSAEYNDHVRGVLRKLAPDSTRLQVTALPEILEMLTGQLQDRL